MVYISHDNHDFRGKKKNKRKTKNKKKNKAHSRFLYVIITCRMQQEKKEKHPKLFFFNLWLKQSCRLTDSSLLDSFFRRPLPRFCVEGLPSLDFRGLKMWTLFGAV
jgi:hypothetical protein